MMTMHEHTSIPLRPSAVDAGRTVKKRVAVGETNRLGRPDDQAYIRYALIALAFALASCAPDGGGIFGTENHAWKTINGEGVPYAEARAQCDAEAQRATAAISFLSRRLATQRRLSDECMIKRGY